MMAGLKRSLIYWGRSIEKFFMLMLLIAFATSVGMSVMSGEIDFGYIAYYVPLIFSISILALAYTNTTTSLSNMIALGATRRESFLGMQIIFHLLVLQGMVITGILLWLLPIEYATDMVTLTKYIMALYILACAFGNVVNIVVLKGRINTAKIVYVGVLIVIVMLDIIVLQVCEYIEIPFLGTISLGAMVIGIVLDVVSVWKCQKAVREYEVRV